MTRVSACATCVTARACRDAERTAAPARFKHPSKNAGSNIEGRSGLPIAAPRASGQTKGVSCWCTHCTATRSGAVPAAAARAARQAKWALFISPAQSTAQTTMGFPAPSKTKPIASSGSSTAIAGATSPPSNG